jgi:hypothetical protein
LNSPNCSLYDQVRPLSHKRVKVPAGFAWWEEVNKRICPSVKPIALVDGWMN